jgi:hypothetical protein
MTVSGDIADPFTPTLTPDDFFDVIFDMCNDGATVTHGDLHFIVDAFSGDFLGGMYDLTMTATFTSFQVTTSDDTLTSNGDATIQLNNLSLSAITVQSSGAMLTIDRNSSSETQTNFSTTQIVNAQDPMLPYTLTTAGTLDSTQLTFVVDYSTPTEFAGFGADYPGSGVFLVSDGMSSATLTAIDNVNVRIDIDTDNNGMVDDTINTTWAALEGG